MPFTVYQPPKGKPGHGARRLCMLPSGQSVEAWQLRKPSLARDRKANARIAIDDVFQVRTEELDDLPKKSLV